MKLYGIDVDINATAYIKAETREEALAIARRDLTNTGLELSSRHWSLGDNLCVDGRSYECLLENEEDIALSPAMSINEQQFRLDDVDEVHTFGEKT